MFPWFGVVMDFVDKLVVVVLCALGAVSCGCSVMDMVVAHCVVGALLEICLPKFVLLIVMGGPSSCS